MKIISEQDWYDRPVLGICTGGTNLYLFVLIDEQEGKDIFSYTILDSSALYDMMIHKKDLHTIITENLTFKGMMDNPLLTLFTPTDDEKPKKGEFY